MKKIVLTLVTMLMIAASFAQVGIGTTSPNSTLDVRGSLAMNYRAFSTSVSALATDNMLVFTGTSVATLTLPDATTCAGRVYWVKNVSSNTSVLSIATTSSQTIDGLSGWSLDESKESIRLISNGANWYVVSQSVPNNTGSDWMQGGNTLAAIKTLGTVSNHDLPFITNNTEKMRLTSTGNLGVGTSSFNSTYPERLLVDAGATGNTNFQNVIVGKGNTNNYAQLNIQNSNAGTSASSDVVATADNGNELINFVDLGINSSVNSSGVMGGSDDAYLYNIGQNFLIGTGTTGKALSFLTGGTAQGTNERMRITGTGSVGIATTTPAAVLDVNGTYKLGTAGSVLNGMIKTSVVVNDPATFAYTSTEQVSVTVTGVALNANVIVNPRTALPTGIGIGWARVSAANTVIIGFTNTDVTARAVGNITFDITVIQ